MVNEKSAKILQEKVKDEKFVKKLLETDTEEEALKFLASEEIEMTKEDLNAFKDAATKVIENGDELSDEDLEDVAGGCIVIGAGVTAFTIVAAIAGVGGAIGGTVGFVNTVTRRRW